MWKLNKFDKRLGIVQDMKLRHFEVLILRVEFNSLISFNVFELISETFKWNLTCPLFLIY